MVSVVIVMVAAVMIPLLPAATMKVPHNAIAFKVTRFAAAFGDDAAAGKAASDAHVDDAAAAAAQTKKSKSKQDSVTLKASPARSAAAARKRFAHSSNSFVLVIVFLQSLHLQFSMVLLCAFLILCCA